jgi:hypothetical protein
VSGAHTLGRGRARRGLLTLAAAAVAGSAAARPAHAQPAAPDASAEARALAERVARSGDGPVRFSFATRPGVCGDGAGGVTWARLGDTTHIGTWNGRYASDDPRTWRCVPGPAHVTVTVRGGAPAAVRLTVGGPTPAGGAAGVDLGSTGPAAAAAYLLDLARRPDAPSPDQTVLAAVVADAGVVWPGLLRLARTEGAPSAARRAGAHWASQFACEAVHAERARRGGLARADTANREVRRQVVFALSQQRGDEPGAALARVARDDRDPAVQCSALFWIGQGAGGRVAADPAALALFETVLRRQ